MIAGGMSGRVLGTTTIDPKSPDVDQAVEPTGIHASRCNPSQRVAALLESWAERNNLRKAMWIRNAVILFVLLSTPAMLTGCQRVQYRFYDYEPGVVRDGQMSITMSLSGTVTSGDSARHHVERRGSPYGFHLYITPTATPIDVIDVRLTAIPSGHQVSPTLSQLRPLEGDTLRRMYAYTDQLVLPYEDYKIDLRLRIQSGSIGRDTILTGMLRRKYESAERNRFFERAMGI